MIPQERAETLFEVLRDHCQRSDAKIHIDDCSFCKYPLGYVWIGQNLFFDAGCWCLKDKLMEPREESELIEFIRKNHPRSKSIDKLMSLLTH